jgi:hypothetical protein
MMTDQVIRVDPVKPCHVCGEGAAHVVTKSSGRRIFYCEEHLTQEARSWSAHVRERRGALEA